MSDRALKEIRTRYGDSSSSKWDEFNSIFAVLHHPRYRERYAANLLRELLEIALPRSVRENAAEITVGV